jgi:hypothetical protein
MLRAVAFLSMDQAVIDMVVDELALGAGNGILDGLELLSQIDTGTSLLDHGDNAAKVSGGTIKPLYDCRMACVLGVGHVFLSHDYGHLSRSIPRGG